jgi:hypothetical protein
MKALDWLERRLKWAAVPNVTLYLVFFQGVALVLTLVKGPAFLVQLLYIPFLVRAGDWWRPLTFLITPPAGNPALAIFGLYFFYLMGSALEGYWGAFRFNLYLLVGYVAALAAAWLQPFQPAQTMYFEGSVFLAFAWLYPDYIILLFFILPVKVKWLALLTLIVYAYFMVRGDWTDSVVVLASGVNFLLFFGNDLISWVRYRGRLAPVRTAAPANQGKAMHVCTTCGATEQTHKNTVFYYCPQCAGTPGYCEEHINNHVHRKEG